MSMRKAFTAGLMAPILIVTTCVMLAGPARAQTPTGVAYMRAVSANGHAIAGESTEPAYNGWIPLRQITMPTGAQMAAMAEENSTAAGSGPAAGTSKTVHPPIVVVKDRDKSSLALLGAFTSRQHFPEIEITLTDSSGKAAKKYKLTDAMIVSVRAGGGGDGTQETVEQLRISYAKIEAQ